MIKKYIQENEGRMLEELFSLIRIPSVSAQQAHKPDMLRCAERWKELLLMAGADKAEVMPSDGNPMVYGEKMVDPKAKTVLIYGHYDVMPAEPKCATSIFGHVEQMMTRDNHLFRLKLLNMWRKITY